MSQPFENVTIPGPDSLSPAEIEAKAETIAEGKAALPFGKTFVLSVLAGSFIALGAMFFCIVMGDSSIPFVAQRLLGGLCFSLGLVLVLCCGAELFTGNALMVCAKASGKIPLAGMLRNWAIVWVGNLVGALCVVGLVLAAQMPAMNGGAVAEAMVSVASGKVSPEWTTLFFKGVMCNVLVCLAVWIGYSARTVVDKVAGVLLPICAFVAAGFEHCVANMFFLPIALFLNGAGVGAEGAIAIGGIVCNLSAATLGNVVGGLLVGLAYWYVYHRK